MIKKLIVSAVALVTTLSELSFAESVPTTADDLSASVARIPKAERPRIAEKLAQIQSITLSQIKEIQTTLLNIRSDTVTATTTKDLALNAKEQDLIDTRRAFVASQVAKQVVSGTAVNLPPKDLEQIVPDMLESIAIASNPMLPTCGTSLSYLGDSAQAGWQDILGKFLKDHGDVLSSVGRLEIETETVGPPDASGIPAKKNVRTSVGSAFAISQHQVVTAGHVAAMFWDPKTNGFRDGVKSVIFDTGGEYEFGCKKPSPDARSVRIATATEYKYTPNVAPKNAPVDFAILRIASDEKPLNATLTIAENVNIPVSSFIIVVEYPANDNRVNQILWRSAMSVPIEGGGMFPVTNIKRVAPGMIVPACENSASLHVTHDATTLNRSSGAPILDAATGQVIGLQVSGFRDLGGVGQYCNLGIKANNATFANAVLEK
ncbi:serine protease [Caballeronia sp. ATUFL_F2_KS9A]|uniref:trypsin-like serine peptidase n=1 Tax=Caballeronia sp. ATUFL_F2_KS9A TaxID=2921777 RepID=UPI002028C166|nr:serine protease [Caballeronia sp. ATUFL_F2_KS9A]